jgi:eukaryotic-like serine/threonine-protein kinase
MLATGQHYMDFTLQQDELHRQITNAAPLPFADRGLAPWPALEAALCRALAVAPAARHADMAAFAAALESAAPTLPAPAARGSDGAENFVQGLLAHIGIDGDLYRNGLAEGPRCSINFGAAGIAYALNRLACRRDDPRLLAAADAWIIKAQAGVEGEHAFYVPAMELTEDTVGRVSPYHARPGVHLVQAMIAETRGEKGLRDTAARAFLAAIEAPCPERDLTLGRGGTVMGCALLLETLPDPNDALWHQLRRDGEKRLQLLWTETAGFDSITKGRQWANVGVAHGWAGLLYVTLRWHALTGMELPPSFHDRLAQLLDCARPTGRGVTWPWRQRAEDGHRASMPGWCNGSAGIAHLACAARAALGDNRLLETAEAAAWHAWEAGDGPVDLCCGHAGRAFALLDVHRGTQDPAWLARARVLAERAVKSAPAMRSSEHPRHSLYKGELGLALLIADLDQPTNAAMPMFAPEGWR